MAAAIAVDFKINSLPIFVSPACTFHNLLTGDIKKLCVEQCFRKPCLGSWSRQTKLLRGIAYQDLPCLVVLKKLSYSDIFVGTTFPKPNKDIQPKISTFNYKITR